MSIDYKSLCSFCVYKNTKESLDARRIIQWLTAGHGSISFFYFPNKSRALFCYYSGVEKCQLFVQTIRMAKTADPMAVTWMEKYSKTMDRIWTKLPNFIGSFIATVAVFLLGASIRGTNISRA